MTIVETTRPITGGVDTHADVHVAAAVDANGGVLGVESFATTPRGFAELHAWLARFGPLERIGVEGTGTYGAGLARYLRTRDLAVIRQLVPHRSSGALLLSETVRQTFTTAGIALPTRNG